MTIRSDAAAVNRFGLGAMPGEREQVTADPRGWLQSQLAMKPDLAAFSGLPDSLEMLRRRAEIRVMARTDREQGGRKLGDRQQADRKQSDRQSENTNATRRERDDSVQEIRRREPRGFDAASSALLTSASQSPSSSMAGAMQEQTDVRAKDRRGERSDEYKISRRDLARDALADIAARYSYAAATSTPFVERLVRFWSNHFAVSVDKNVARLQAAPMEREAIRPHVLGNFADLLVAVETHPAMLLYLDNAVSVGTDSMLSQRFDKRAERRAPDAQKPKRKLGLNENLAREILELHTLGVNGGYKQGDVQELARTITGWSTPAPRELENATSSFVFRAVAHEPGVRNVLGKRYVEAGQAQGRAVLRDLALHPATAQHLSLKLARHFVSDTPPPALVQRMAAAYLRSGGELSALYRSLIDDDAAWSAGARKFKTPDDFIVSAMRAGGIALAREPRSLIRLLEGLGQPVFTPRSPAGFPDTASDWATGDALRKRLQAASLLADQVSAGRTPYAVAVDVLGTAAVDGDLGSLLRRAGSPREGFALLFSSPAFQWRT